MKKIIALLVLLVTMFMVVGCVPKKPNPTPEVNEPTFIGVTMALDTKKSEVEKKFQVPTTTSSRSSDGYMKLSSPVKSMNLLSTSYTNSFDGTIIGDVYIYTKGNREYLVVDIEQPDDFNKILFDLIAVSSNEWDKIRFYGATLTDNVFRHSDDLNQLFIPIDVTGPVSSTQTFKIEYIRYHDESGTKNIVPPDNSTDTVNVLVAGTPIDFQYDQYRKGLYNKEDRSITLNLDNKDELSISKIYINNQLSYTKESLESFPKKGNVTLPIPEEINITSYNWVKVEIEYSLLESDIVSETESLVSEVFLIRDESVTYTYKDEVKFLSPDDYLILSPEDLTIFGDDYFELLNLYFVDSLDLTDPEFLADFKPLNVKELLITSFWSDALGMGNQDLYILTVNQDFVFVDVDDENFTGSAVTIDRVVFNSTTLVGLDKIYFNYQSYEIIYFGEMRYNLQKKS